MSVHFIVDLVLFGFIVLYSVLYRLYKRIGRRCRNKDCGSVNVRRVSKILLPPDETACFRSLDCFYNPKGKFRWFIRRPVKLTFTVCECGWVELVKFDTDPLSLWHCFWVEWFHKEQYYLEDQVLVQAVQRKFRQLYLGGRRQYELDPRASDTPPLSLQSLFKDILDGIDKSLTELIEK